MAYIGKTPITGNFVKLDAISVVNGQAGYTMNNGGSAFTDYENVNQFLVSLNGILQAPTTSFTVSGSTLTFASNLATGDVIDFVMVLGNTLDIGTPSDATVTDAKANFVSTSSGAGLQIKGDGTTDGTLQLNCSQNSHGIKLKSPAHSAGASYTLTFPTTDGNNEEFLQTNGSGVLTWATAGGGNTPHFEAHSSGNQDVSDEAITKVTLATEIVDSDNKFTSSRFTPTVAGKYYIEGQLRAGGSGGQGTVAQVNIYLYKNGSLYRDGYVHNENSSSQSLGEQTIGVSGIIDMDTDDYIELYGRSDIQSGTARFIAGTKSTYLLGYKIG